jgi:hypothetical protein
MHPCAGAPRLHLDLPPSGNLAGTDSISVSVPPRVNATYMHSRFRARTLGENQCEAVSESDEAEEPFDVTEL